MIHTYSTVMCGRTVDPFRGLSTALRGRARGGSDRIGSEGINYPFLPSSVANARGRGCR